METGVATKKLDLEQYAKDLRKRMDDAHSRMNQFLGTYDLSMI